MACVTALLCEVELCQSCRECRFRQEHFSPFRYRSQVAGSVQASRSWPGSRAAARAGRLNAARDWLSRSDTFTEKKGSIGFDMQDSSLEATFCTSPRAMPCCLAGVSSRIEIRAERACARGREPADRSSREKLAILHRNGWQLLQLAHIAPRPEGIRSRRLVNCMQARKCVARLAVSAPKGSVAAAQAEVWWAQWRL